MQPRPREEYSSTLNTVLWDQDQINSAIFSSLTEMQALEIHKTGLSVAIAGKAHREPTSELAYSRHSYGTNSSVLANCG